MKPECGDGASGSVGIDVQIAAVKREIAMREMVFPRRVAAGKMKQAFADREIAAMRAVLATLVRLDDLGGVARLERA